MLTVALDERRAWKFTVSGPRCLEANSRLERSGLATVATTKQPRDVVTVAIDL